jgi:hypothetical protein
VRAGESGARGAHQLGVPRREAVAARPEARHRPRPRRPHQLAGAGGGRGVAQVDRPACVPGPAAGNGVALRRPWPQNRTQYSGRRTLHRNPQRTPITGPEPASPIEHEAGARPLIPSPGLALVHQAAVHLPGPDTAEKGWLSALRAHTKAPHKIYLHRKTLRNAKAA